MTGEKTLSARLRNQFVITGCAFVFAVYMLALSALAPARAAEILADWKRYCPLFKKVMPVEYRRALAEMAKEKAAAMQAAE